MEQYWIENIAGKDFENAALKNNCIAKTKEPVLIFANRDVTSGEELVQMLAEYPYMEQTDVLVLCSHAPAQSTLYEVLMDLELTVYAMVVKRSVFNRVSLFNDRLELETNREFLCRAVQECGVLFLECSDVSWKKPYAASALLTNAYLLVRYLGLLRSEKRLEEALSIHMIFAERMGGRQFFEEKLTELMDKNQSVYRQIYLATAPIIIFRGTDVCYGIMAHFTDALANAFSRKGQRVIWVDYGLNDKAAEEALSKRTLYQAIIGFQSPILFRSAYTALFDGHRFGFWVDHPIFFYRLFNDAIEPVTILCQDGDHAEYINRMCAKHKAIHFPPAVDLTVCELKEKKYDISFMGTYQNGDGLLEIIKQKEGIAGKAAMELAEYLLTHPDIGFDEAIDLFLGQYPQLLEYCPYEVAVQNFFESCRLAPAVYRKRVIRTILDAGYALHVYGDSWKDYPVQEGDRLVLHDEVAPADMAKAISQSRISLNVFTWHKDGMTERIMEIMSAGTVCLTDESRYLKRHFTQWENIVMYRLDQLDELPGMIGRLLEDESLRNKITANAYEKVKKEHTWDVRAGQLLELVRQGQD